MTAELMDKDVYSTGEAAQICGVSQQTIIRCFDSGRLHGFRVPGSRFRRIPRAELIGFMRAHNIDTTAIERPVMRVLLVDGGEHVDHLLIISAGGHDRFEIRRASSGYHAGMVTGQFRPHLILVHAGLPDINGALVCRSVRSNPELQGTRVLILAEDDGDGEDGTDGTVRAPVDLDALMASIDTRTLHA